MALIEIIEKQTKLRSQAHTFYQDIEGWYRDDDRGYVVYAPMNVVVNFKGASSRPCHTNAFILARGLYQFSSNGINTLEKTMESFSQFARVTVVAPEVTHSLTTGTRIIELPAQFIPRLSEFISKLNELNAAVNSFESDDQSDNKDFENLLHSFVNYLLKNEFSLENIRSACAASLKKPTKDATTADAKDYEENVEFSLSEIIALHDSFYNTLPCRMFSMRINAATGRVVTEPESDIEKEQRLEGFLTQHLRHPAFISMFERAAFELYFPKEYRTENLPTDGRWAPHSFWAPIPQIQRDKFAPTLDAIKTGQFSLRTPK